LFLTTDKVEIAEYNCSIEGTDLGPGVIEEIEEIEGAVKGAWY